MCVHVRVCACARGCVCVCVCVCVCAGMCVVCARASVCRCVSRRAQVCVCVRVCVCVCVHVRVCMYIHMIYNMQDIHVSEGVFKLDSDTPLSAVQLYVLHIIYHMRLKACLSLIPTHLCRQRQTPTTVSGAIWEPAQLGLHTPPACIRMYVGMYA